jgi:hypothetical protein
MKQSEIQLDSLFDANQRPAVNFCPFLFRTPRGETVPQKMALTCRLLFHLQKYLNAFDRLSFVAIPAQNLLGKRARRLSLKCSNWKARENCIERKSLSASHFKYIRLAKTVI